MSACAQTKTCENVEEWESSSSYSFSHKNRGQIVHLTSLLASSRRGDASAAAVKPLCCDHSCHSDKSCRGRIGDRSPRCIVMETKNIITTSDSYEVSG